MKVNNLEFLAMNNPVRAFIQEKYEVKILKSMASKTDFQVVLEVGCGNGTGTKLVKKYFSPRLIMGVDLDERMVRIAARRNTDASISYQVVDASRLDFPDRTFDGVFDFGIIHHIPNWQEAVCEIKRVLKPDGELILEDLSIDSFSMDIGNVWRVLSDHPYQAMYTPGQFTGFLKEIGFMIESYKESNPLGLIRFFSLTARLR
jgi:ubiquinone/menaquinone biosynthesis C-methylase UbiE